MTDCGCSGKWTISSSYSGAPSDVTDIDGFALDDPILVSFSDGCSHGTNLVSSCDGRVMYARWTCSTPGATITNKVWNPGPDCNATYTYDCLNGQCVKSSEYTTPGLYKSLADCQAVCANGGACAAGKQCVDPTNYCPEGKVCIDQDEYSNIQGLIAKINSEVC